MQFVVEKVKSEKNFRELKFLSLERNNGTNRKVHRSQVAVTIDGQIVGCYD